MTDYAKMLRMLESPDTRVYEDARDALRIQIEVGNWNVIKALVVYFSDYQSERVIDLLVQVHEPFDKYLLDGLEETFKKRPVPVIILIGLILQRPPMWVSRIGNHSFFKTLITTFNRTKRERVLLEDIATIFLMCNILHSSTALPEQALKQIYGMFIVACEQIRTRMRELDPEKDPENAVNYAHLHFAARELFLMLYGVYPNHFVLLTKQYLSDCSVERERLFRYVIRPMIASARLHPGLLDWKIEFENSNARWNNLENHDLLEEAKRLQVGPIPVPFTLIHELEMEDDVGGMESEEEDTVPMSDLYMRLYASKSSGASTSDNVWEDMDEEEMMKELWKEMEVREDRADSPKHRSLNEPMVLDGKRRRSTGPSEEKGRRSFKSALTKLVGGPFSRGSIKEVVRPQRERLPEVEIVGAEEEEEGQRRNSEQLDEAEEAVDPLEKIAAKARLQRRATEEGEEHFNRGDTSSTREGVRRSVKGRERAESIIKGEDENSAVARSRSASLLTQAGVLGGGRSDSVASSITGLFRQKGGEEEEDEGEKRDKKEEMCRACAVCAGPGAGTSSSNGDEVAPCVHSKESHPRSRFSVSSFFYKLNRQRFRSECPPTDNDNSERNDHIHSVTCNDETKKENEEQKTIVDVLPPSNTLKRTTSCPILIEEAVIVIPPPVVNRPKEIEYEEDEEEGGTRKRGIKGKDEREEGMTRLLTQFPYLSMLNQPTKEYRIKMERYLEKGHDNAKDKYMEASKLFHYKLKELNLADKLPGKIYDDMNHIMKDLPVEQQRDLYCSRLALVNQHLLYERSARLLHASRNRKLFARLKMQTQHREQFTTLNEKLHELIIDRDDLIDGLKKYRKIVSSNKGERAEREEYWLNQMNDKKKEITSLEKQLKVQEEENRIICRERDSIKLEVDKAKSDAENARAEKKLADERFMAARMHKMTNELDSLRDEVAMSERRRREELSAASPDFVLEERTKELEKELERVRVERERMRSELEEQRQKRMDAEESLKEETGRALVLRSKLDRAAKMLVEQKDAAEQKFLSLQCITQRQEEEIIKLNARMEDYADMNNRSRVNSGDSSCIDDDSLPRRARRIAIPNGYDMRSDESSQSVHSRGSDLPPSFYSNDLISGDEMMKSVTDHNERNV